ncbi:radical SAM/SPASM domain-containing protein [Pseudodesulfovibrio sediminis]|uniref:Radical SAM protein n=1 Tax=Pseudodesulfovibrio sediminis TaxID=2810563 RepID=A0ABM7P866_9BACT|nr:radical SAM/SPASM domain-containing protein [Pseudodesulfovibrio sediminis]BCS89183.1 radical SAM protein [Pseudodesulfovibrio sediminis]
MQLVSLEEAFSGLNKEEKTKKYRELWHKAARFEILTDYPLHLDLELSGVCNLSCKDCFQEALDKKNLGLMDPALFKRIIDEGVPRGLCAIKLQIRGESFLHPDIFELISYAKQAGVLDVQVTTNATLIRDETIDQILVSGLDGIIFSVDVRHQEACDKASATPEYDHVSTVVNTLLARRAAQGTPWVRLKSSIDDPSPEAQLALKAQLVEAFPLADIHIVGTIFDFHKDRDSYPDLQQNYTLNPCSYLMQRMAVFWNGQTTVCCMDYHGDFGLPWVSEASVQSIWNSPQMEHLRQAHTSGQRPKLPICKHCHLNVSSATDQVYLDDTRRNRLDRDLGVVCEG